MVGRTKEEDTLAVSILSDWCLSLMPCRAHTLSIHPRIDKPILLLGQSKSIRHVWRVSYYTVLQRYSGMTHGAMMILAPDTGTGSTADEAADSGPICFTGV